jgi:hypothetical protein
VAEQLPEHEDHVLVGVIVVVPEDDVVSRLPAGAIGGGCVLLGRGSCLLDGDGSRWLGLGGGGLG